MKLFITITIAIMLITGCASPGSKLPGQISSHTSEFDGAFELFMEAAWMDTTTKMGLFWKSTMPNNELLMEIHVPGGKIIGQNQSFHLNLDGTFLHFTSIDLVPRFKNDPPVVTPFGTFPGEFWSSKRFIIKKELLLAIIASKKPLYKIDLGDTYIEGQVALSGINMLGPAIRDFLPELDKAQTAASPAQKITPADTANGKALDI